MKINFVKKKWEDQFEYAYTYRFEDVKTFVQEKDHIRNRKDKANKAGYENISMFYKEKLINGTLISTTCSFDSYGAPLLCLAKDLIQEKECKKIGDYIEIVIYENGLNVWKMTCVNKKVSWYKVVGVDFKLQPKKKYKIKANIQKQRLYIEINRHKIQVGLPDCQESYYWGIDACEGINRFYDFEIIKGDNNGR